ncbi:MAG TPA: hypothetical protein C5S50_10310 [Methanosarcinaceae archaeon]|nr:hypothetical protein [Methanosarcinaceae archaeon]
MIIHNGLRFVDGSDIGLKDYVNIKVDVPLISDVELMHDGMTIASASGDDEYLFLGIEPGINYTVHMGDPDNVGQSVKNYSKKQEVFAVADMIIEFEPQIMASGNNGTSRNTQHLVGGILILLINAIGLVIIAGILKK